MPAENLCQGALNTIAGILRGIHQVAELTPNPRDTGNPHLPCGSVGVLIFTDRIGS